MMGGSMEKKNLFPGCELFMGEGGRLWSLRWLGHKTDKLSSRVSVASLLTEPQLSGGDLDRG